MAKKKTNTGKASKYSPAEAAALEAAVAAAWAEYSDAYSVAEAADERGRAYPTTIYVVGDIEWSGESRGVRGTYLYNLDLREVIEALNRARPATSAARAAAPPRSYRAKGWRAQLRQLERTRKGRAAAAAAGLSPAPRTLRGWMLGKTPNKANIDRIHTAYESVREQPVITARETAQRANRAVVDALNDALRNEYGTEIRLFSIQQLTLET